VGRGGLDNNLMYGNNLRSLDRDLPAAPIPSFHPDSLSEPLIKKLDFDYINNFANYLNNIFYDAQEDLDIPDLITIDRDSESYPKYLNKFTAYGLKRLAEYDHNQLNESTQNRRILESYKTDYRIGWQDETIEEFNRSFKLKNNDLDSYNLYKTPSIGDKVTFRIDDLLYWAQQVVSISDYEKPPYSVLEKMLNEKNREVITFKVDKFSYQDQSMNVIFEDGEQLTEHPFLIVEKDNHQQSVLDNTFLIEGAHPELGPITVPTWATELETINASNGILKTSPIDIPYKDYSLVNENNHPVVEVYNDFEAEVHRIPDQLVEIADKLISDIQDTPVTTSSFLEIKGTKWSRNKKKQAINKLIAEHPSFNNNQAEIFLDFDKNNKSFTFKTENCPGKLGAEISQQLSDLVK
jgi:hypothetical protein